MVHKEKIECPYCKEKQDITIGSYISAKWTDPQSTALECFCGKCNKYFYPNRAE